MKHTDRGEETQNRNETKRNRKKKQRKRESTLFSDLDLSFLKTTFLSEKVSEAIGEELEEKKIPKEVCLKEHLLREIEMEKTSG